MTGAEGGKGLPEPGGESLALDLRSSPGVEGSLALGLPPGQESASQRQDFPVVLSL